MEFIKGENGRLIYIPSEEARHNAGTVAGWIAIAMFVVAALLIMW